MLDSVIIKRKSKRERKELKKSGILVFALVVIIFLLVVIKFLYRAVPGTYEIKF